MTHSCLRLLRAHVRREQQRTLAVGLVATLVAGLLSLAAVAGRDPSAGRWLVLALLGGAAAYLLRAGQRSVDSHAGVRAVLAGGHHIVWIYVLRVGRGFDRGAWLHLGLMSGEIAQVALSARGDHALILQLIELAPHATTGYDRSFERRFRANPAALRRR